MEIFHRFSHTRALKFQGLEINPDNKFGNDRKMLDVKNVITQVKKKVERRERLIKDGLIVLANGRVVKKRKEKEKTSS